MSDGSKVVGKAAPRSAQAGTIAATPTPLTSPRLTSGVAQGRPGAISTGRSRKGPPPDPWKEVEAAKAEADALEAELAMLEAKLQEVSQEVRGAAEASEKAELELTSRTASMLEEYALEHTRCLALEGELTAARSSLEARRRENLELSRRNIELDREAKLLQGQLKEAEEALDRRIASQGSLDKELHERQERCKRLQEQAAAQGERFRSDLRRLGGIKERLLGLSKQQALSPEVLTVIAELDAMLLKTQQGLEECETVAREGVAPAPAVLEDCAETGGDQISIQSPEVGTSPGLGPAAEPEPEATSPLSSISAASRSPVT